MVSEVFKRGTRYEDIKIFGAITRVINKNIKIKTFINILKLKKYNWW